MLFTLSGGEAGTVVDRRSCLLLATGNERLGQSGLVWFCLAVVFLDALSQSLVGLGKETDPDQGKGG